MHEHIMLPGRSMYSRVRGCIVNVSSYQDYSKQQTIESKKIIKLFLAI